MKKLALVIAVAGIVGLSSCKKCNSCEFSSSTTTEYCSDTYTTAQLDALESTCKLAGGTWK